MATIRVKVYAGKDYTEDLTEGKGVEVPWNSLRDIVEMGLVVEVMKDGK